MGPNLTERITPLPAGPMRDMLAPFLLWAEGTHTHVPRTHTQEDKSPNDFLSQLFA